MAVYNYAETFTQLLAQKYAAELKSNALFNSNPGVRFMNAQTIKLPRLTVSGYKDHTRTIGFNAGSLSNDWEPKKLMHDRDIEFFVDAMDIDETNLTLSMANIQNTFEEEQAIPEQDAYAFSKLVAETKKADSENIDSTAITAANFLELFDAQMQAMDEASVPESGRIMYLTPSMNKIAKECSGISREILVSGYAGVINRKTHSIDDVEMIMVPSDRMKSAYDFTDGFTPDEAAKQINTILVHPSAVIGRKKYSYIKLFTPGHDSRVGDGYLYQNRSFLDIFIIERKADGVQANVSA